jgi:hypothetical protein
MTIGPPNSQAAYLPTSIVLPFDDNELLIRLTQFLTEVALKVNQRQIGVFELSEVVAGQLWFSDSANIFNKRQCYRKTFIFPVITAPGTTSQLHNLGQIGDFKFVHGYGSITTSDGTKTIFIPTGAPDDVTISVLATTVNIITNTATFNNGSATITIEYLKN